MKFRRHNQETWKQTTQGRQVNYKQQSNPRAVQHSKVLVQHNQPNNIDLKPKRKHSRRHQRAQRQTQREKPSPRQQQNSSGKHHQNTGNQAMHLNLEGNATATKNKHNTVLGKPHFYQNLQRRTLGAPHWSSQPVSTRPTTIIDKCLSTQPAMQHSTQNIYLARATTPTEQSIAHNGAHARETKHITNTAHTPTT
ncbi:hypothetical protein Taro_022501 [Colocasia esculenta]|uniref:Uncharacterized protein n=1 Tax=Colocasia esculenta TaxID=4460 RepID=A0A843V5I4_COLES|nr:hypothetical protein [Colocasia esculenta]